MQTPCTYVTTYSSLERLLSSWTQQLSQLRQTISDMKVSTQDGLESSEAKEISSLLYLAQEHLATSERAFEKLVSRVSQHTF